MTTHKNTDLSPEWVDWCGRGRHGVAAKRRALEICCDNGKVRGWYSDIVLDPNKKQTDSMYPSIDHVSPGDNANLKVEARLFNDMKSHLTEAEFWRVVEHLYSVGREKNKIKNRKPYRLPAGWKPWNNYG